MLAGGAAEMREREVEFVSFDCISRDIFDMSACIGRMNPRATD